MFYVKTYLSEGTDLCIGITSHNVYTKCLSCRKEVHIDLNDLIRIGKGRLDNTGIICERCLRKEQGYDRLPE